MRQLRSALARAAYQRVARRAPPAHPGPARSPVDRGLRSPTVRVVDPAAPVRPTPTLWRSTATARARRTSRTGPVRPSDPARRADTARRPAPRGGCQGPPRDAGVWAGPSPPPGPCAGGRRRCARPRRCTYPRSASVTLRGIVDLRGTAGPRERSRAAGPVAATRADGRASCRCCRRAARRGRRRGRSRCPSTKVSRVLQPAVARSSRRPPATNSRLQVAVVADEEALDAAAGSG